jgi:hypothetical protein
MAGDVSEPYRLYWTDPTNPIGYDPALNFQDFSVKIKALGVLPGVGLLIFEEHKTWMWRRPPFSGPPEILAPNVGCTSQESVKQVSGTVAYYDEHDRLIVVDSPVVWTSSAGVQASNGGAPVNISRRINAQLLEMDIDDADVTYDARNEIIRVGVAST